jgi:hypothetical protein
MPKPASRSRLSLVGAVAMTTAAAFVLTGCHSSSKGAAATSAAPGAAAASLAGGSAPAAAQQSLSASIGGSAKASCKQLTDAEVQPLTIDKIVKDDITAANLGADTPGQQCVFSGADGAGSVDVLVTAGPQAAPGYASEIAGYSDGVVAVPGIGDKASREKGDGQVVALKGDVYCSVSLGSGDQVPGLGPLMEAAGGTTHIAESAYQTTAEALGTLCNRIYGSGNTTPDLSSLVAADAAASASAAASAGPASPAAAASS